MSAIARKQPVYHAEACALVALRKIRPFWEFTISMVAVLVRGTRTLSLPLCGPPSGPHTPCIVSLTKALTAVAVAKKQGEQQT